jgi:hypothetical protein
MLDALEERLGIGVKRDASRMAVEGCMAEGEARLASARGDRSGTLILGVK